VSTGRSYVYALPSHNATGAEVWKLNGTWRKGSWNFDKFLKSLAKAKASGYSRFVISEVAVELPDFEKLIQEVQRADLKPVLQVSDDTHLAKIRSFVLQNEIAVERWIVDQWPDWEQLRSLKKTNEISLKILGIKSNNCLFELGNIPEDFCEFLEFYFPYFLDKKRKFFPREIIAWEELVQKNHPQLRIKSAKGVDIYEPRIGEELELEPCHPPLVCSHPSLTPQISVIIPTYNNGLYLLNTLRHLDQQKLSYDNYEVVIVDDGSSDKMSEGLLGMVKDFQMPVRLLYYPRMKPRKMGDNQFRAGLARNYGVKFARGDLLVFLDSDILTPPDFLQKTLELHGQYEVVQWRREYFHKNVPSISMHYSEVRQERDCYQPEGGYWHRFYEAAGEIGWGKIENHWKYACTYGFSLKKSLFNDVGCFRKTFCFYGLEDTDLGWRLAQKKCSFYLEQTPVYHLFHENSRSEFFNSAFKRQKLLKSTAEIFFYNNLSPEIYRVFQYLFNSWIF
jgi:glycosyltransferase involved in cell wall biosynthesis